MDFFNDAAVPNMGDLMPAEAHWQVPVKGTGKAAAEVPSTFGHPLSLVDESMGPHRAKPTGSGQAAHTLRSSSFASPFEQLEGTGQSPGYDRSFPSPEWQSLLGPAQPAAPDLHDWSTLLAVPHTSHEASASRTVPEILSADSPGLSEAQHLQDQKPLLAWAPLADSTGQEGEASDSQSALSASCLPDAGHNLAHRGERSLQLQDLASLVPDSSSPTPGSLHPGGIADLDPPESFEPRLVPATDARSALRPRRTQLRQEAAQRAHPGPQTAPASVVGSMPHPYNAMPGQPCPGHEAAWYPEGQAAHPPYPGVPALGIPCIPYMPEASMSGAGMRPGMPAPFPFKCSAPAGPFMGHLQPHAHPFPGFFPCADFPGMMHRPGMPMPSAVSTHKRASRLEICREKKRNRSSVGGVKIRYHMRQITAHMRPRLRGRFVKSTALNDAAASLAANAAEDAQDADACASMSDEEDGCSLPDN